MKIPLSWLKDFVDINVGLEELARLLTGAGLEVDSVQLVGLPMPAGEKHQFKYSGLSWEADKIVVAQINEVMPHPNADRLVLCKLFDGKIEHVVLTGAPDLQPFKGQGALQPPIKVAYAKEGARIYDGHQPGLVLTTLKRAKIRGVESYSMVCSEKELGISEEHEGIIHLDPDAPTGTPLVDYMGDAIFEISILPNMARCANVIGVAREVAAITGAQLHQPVFKVPMDGPSIKGQVDIRIENAPLNPRFVLGLVRGVTPKSSPYWVQRRLRLAGMRPINSIVDATNYAMLELGEPLHAFDYDVLVQRAGGKAPTIITRTAKHGERLTTLDDVDRSLDDFTVLVTDTAGPLSIAGVMGGAESEVTPNTQNILLEGASWNYINIRKTSTSQRLSSEAGYRFARGVHPALAETGVRSCLERMTQWSGGQIAEGLVDAYPLPQENAVVEISTDAVRRLLGIDLSAQEIADLLKRLFFECTIKGHTVVAIAPPHRLDIGADVIGIADVIEEVARIYGYDNIPYTRLSDTLPKQRRNALLEGEDRVRDTLVNLGLQEVVSYRLTTPEREARLLPKEKVVGLPYVRLQNPVTPERSTMRRSLLSSVMEAVQRNSRLRDHLAMFELGPVFLPHEGQVLPDEPAHLAMVMTGRRNPPHWEGATNESGHVDFYDLKGIVEALLNALHLQDITFEPTQHPTYHPGKSAQIKLGDTIVGVLGELHPLVKENFSLGNAPVLVADIELQQLLAAMPMRYEVRSVPVFPPILEDIAVVVDEETPAANVARVIRQAGGKSLTDLCLFDIFRGEQLGQGKKSLAYSLTYQAEDRTLTDVEVAKTRERIVRNLEKELGAKLRS